jgi:hypothetical protein
MPQPGLTTLANLNDWLGEDPDTNADNVLLGRMIGQVSRAICSYLQRPLLIRHTYSDIYDGAGGGRQMLRQWPVLSVGSLAIGTRTIPAAASYGQAGFRLEPWDGLPPGRPQSLDVSGDRFREGRGNVAVTYTAGYAVQAEAQTVPSSSNYSVAVNAPYGNWAADSGVTYSDGTALAAVSSAPALGQYAVKDGVYTFAAADATAQVLISYSFTPADLEQVCIEQVAERYQYKDRIGTVSKSLGGQETMSYSQKDMSDYVKGVIQPYRRVISV